MTRGMGIKTLILLMVLLLHRVEPLPLSTKGRWIVDAVSGRRVKLHCVNWVGHMPAVIPEGLNRKPVAVIASKVASLGFNCVRLTWAIDMVTKPMYQNLTVAGSLSQLKLDDAVKGVHENNPTLLDRLVIDAFDAVIKALGDAGVMVILDNHVSKPMWCCGMDDGNGFFGDTWFNPDEWVQALRTMASRFKGVHTVIGMSMRNELRGPRSNVPDWYKYMTLGADAIHTVNPDVLVVVSGLNYDCDLSHLRNRAFPIINDKIVFEAHWYAFSEGRAEEWEHNNPTSVCPGVTHRFDYRIGFVNHRAQTGSGDLPLFISEYGYDQRRVDLSGNRFLPCFFAYAAEMDIDWALWTLEGSYYRRQGEAGFEETYGVLDSGWEKLRDPNFDDRFSLLQEMITDPTSKTPEYQIIYHPLTGKCLWADPLTGAIDLRNCKNRSKWGYYGEGTRLMLLDSYHCLNVDGEGRPVTLAENCSTTWRDPGSARLQLSAVADNGDPLCMDWSAGTVMSAVVVARPCKCVSGDTCADANPQTQWFKVVNANV